MRSWRLAATILVVAGAAACGEGKASPKKEAKAGAAKGAALGDGMCEEHGVLEAICTKCNPKLIPVFQAKGDWCDEHGFPESVCPICHPERGGKPAADVKMDGAPADGARVRLESADTAAKAGIATAKAVARPEGAGLVATAMITFDATKRAIVNARAPGVVREIKADVGTKVERGTPLTVIESAQVGSDRSRLQSTVVRIRIAQSNYDREKGLAAQGIASNKEVLAAQQELEAARAERAAILAGLGSVGGGAGARGAYTLTAPLAGRVIARQATIGKQVGVEEPLFEIVDTSTMWAQIDIPEDELVDVAVGQDVVVTVDGLGARTFKGTISYIAPMVDEQTRTAEARAELPNPEGHLRGNMFAQARIILGGLGGDRAAVTVPSAAVQRVKDVFFVFVRISEQEFELRRVQMGAAEGTAVELRRGVKPGEEVVTQGSFLLKTELMKDAIGAGCCTDD